MKQVVPFSLLLLLTGCAGALARDELGNPEGWLAVALDTIGVLGDAAITVVQNPTAGGIVGGLVMIYGGIRAIFDGKKVATAAVKKTGEAIVRKMNGSA